MNVQWVLAAAVAVLAVVLAVQLFRGRFGTHQEQANLELRELAKSGDVPRKTRLQTTATCRGHNLTSAQLLGAGVLWLTDDALGFVLRTPRRNFRLALKTVKSATVASTYTRQGVEMVADGHDFLVVEWSSPEGTATVAFQFSEPQAWVEEIQRLRY